MVIVCEWRLEEDGITRPIIEIKVKASGNDFVNEPFLVDSGADCSVFTPRLLSRLAVDESGLTLGGTLHGLGGESESVFLEAILQFAASDETNVTVHGKFRAATGPSNLDVSILGRDVLGNFDVIVSRRRNEVLLLASNHTYAVTG